MEDASEQNKILNYPDVFSMDRTNTATNNETGASVGYGIEYNINKKNLENEVYLDATFSIGQILKKNTLKEMPKNSSLQKKKSDFVGNASFEIDSEKFNNSKFDIDYNYIISKNFNSFLKNEITTSLSNDNNSFTLSYYEENKIGVQHYAETKYKREFDNDVSFSLGTRKNFQKHFTERNFIETNYESDCLKIGLSLSKIFYQDEEIKPSNNLTFSITLKPFGSPVAPDLSSFLN
jgi:LPS-assembly protein